MKSLKIYSCALALFCSLGMINFANASGGGASGAIKADALSKLDSQSTAQTEIITSNQPTTK